MSTKIANELRSKGIVIPKASSPEEACELARWLMQQYPKLSPEANAAQPAAAEESAEAAAPEAKEKAAEPNGETAGTLCGVEVVPPGWKPQDDELMHELDELYEAMDQMAKSPRAVQNSRSGSYPSTGLPFAPFHRPAVLPPELQVLTHRLPPILPYAPVYSSPYASPYRPHLPITA